MEFYILLGIFLLAAAIVAVLSRYVLSKDTDWHPHARWRTARPLTLMDGTTTRDPVVMRRKAADGLWQYRRMTEEEEEQWRAGLGGGP